MARQLVVVDVETTGLVRGRHFPLEVAALNVTTGEELYFIPALPDHALECASGDALAINRYFERRLYEHKCNWRDTESRWDELWEMLSGNTLGGSNPTFDADMIIAGYAAALRGGFPAGTVPEPSQVWHHRLADVSAYAAAALQLAPTELVGLADVCKELCVDNAAPHTAMGDARATAECFRILQNIYKAQEVSR